MTAQKGVRPKPIETPSAIVRPSGPQVRPAREAEQVARPPAPGAASPTRRPLMVFAIAVPVAGVAGLLAAVIDTIQTAIITALPIAVLVGVPAFRVLSRVRAAITGRRGR